MGPAIARHSNILEVYSQFKWNRRRERERNAWHVQHACYLSNCKLFHCWRDCLAWQFNRMVLNASGVFCVFVSSCGLGTQGALIPMHSGLRYNRKSGRSGPVNMYTYNLHIFKSRETIFMLFRSIDLFTHIFKRTECLNNWSRVQQCGRNESRQTRLHVSSSRLFHRCKPNGCWALVNAVSLRPRETLSSLSLSVCDSFSVFNSLDNLRCKSKKRMNDKVNMKKERMPKMATEYDSTVRIR